MKFILTTSFGSFLLITTALAASVSVVDSQSCDNVKYTNEPFMLALKKGENIKKSIQQCIKDAKLGGAALTGLGAIEDPKLAFYNINKKTYEHKTFKGVFELISITGTVASSENNHDMNIHVAASDNGYHVFGGHLDDAKVGAIVDITIVPFKNKVNEKIDNDFGMKFISSEA